VEYQQRGAPKLHVSPVSRVVNVVVVEQYIEQNHGAERRGHDAQPLWIRKWTQMRHFPFPFPLLLRIQKTTKKIPFFVGGVDCCCSFGFPFLSIMNQSINQSINQRGGWM